MSMSVAGFDTGASRAAAAKTQQMNNQIIQQAASEENLEAAILGATAAKADDAKASLAEGVGGTVDVSA